MSKIIEKKAVAVVDYAAYKRSLDWMEVIMHYLNLISETSIDNDVRKLISDNLVDAYTGFKEGFIEDRIETAVKPKNIGENIADKIKFRLKSKVKRREA